MMLHLRQQEATRIFRHVIQNIVSYMSRDRVEICVHLDMFEVLVHDIGLLDVSADHWPALNLMDYH